MGADGGAGSNDGNGRGALAVSAAAVGLLYLWQLWRHKFICDDGYIYLTYVGNLFEHGELAFNLGEPVDAATSFLWLIALVVVRPLLFFLDLRQVLFALSIGCSLAAFGLVARHIARGRPGLLVAAALLFPTYFVVSFSTSGLETPAILLWTVSVYLVCERDPWSKTAAVLMGLAPFVRPELALFTLFFVIVGWRQGHWRTLRLAVLLLGVMALLRWLLFGDVIPNTALIKLFRPTYGQGRHYLIELVSSYWHFVALVLAALAIRLSRPRALPFHQLLALVGSAVLILYVGLSGGAFMHGRALLVPYVLLCFFAGETIGELLRHRLAADLASAAASAVAVLAAIAGLMLEPATLRNHDNYFHGISDEGTGWLEETETLGAWSVPSLHPWAERGRRLTRLARRVGRPVGVVANGIGQLGFYRDASLVYVFDRLGLTRAVGTFLDTQGYFARIGHNTPIPRPLVYAEPRVTLCWVPDRELHDRLSFEIAGFDETLCALTDIDAYVGAGLLPGDTWSRVEARIATRLQSREVDRNLVFYLWHRYPAERAYAPAIATHYLAAVVQPTPSWPRWYETHRELIDLAGAIQRGERAALPARYRASLRRAELWPLPSIYQRSSWWFRERATCDVDPSQVELQLPAGVRARWLREDGAQRLVAESGSGRDKHGFIRFDLRPALESCGIRPEQLLVSWTLRSAAGAVPRYFYLPAESPKHRFYRPGPPVKIPVEADGGAPLRLSMRIDPGQELDIAWRFVAVGGD